MIKEFAHLNTNEVFGKVLGFGVGVYAVMLLAQVLQSYSLI